MERIPSLALFCVLAWSGLLAAQEAPPWLAPAAEHETAVGDPLEPATDPPAASDPLPATDPPAAADPLPAEAVSPPAVATPLASPPPAPDTPELEGERIQERYPDGQVKIERYVIQDENQNFLNHGPWKMWDQQQNLICEGTYQVGQRHGAWRRTYRSLDEAEMLSHAPYSDFTLPYESTAHFVDGRLSGAWEMRDAQGRLIFRWEFFDGRRHGKSQWWYPNGNPMRELNYEDGVLQGPMHEWDMSGGVVTEGRFEDGRRIEKRSDTYPGGTPRYEGMVMHPRLVLKTPDDWWECRLAKYEQQGRFEKHGPWTTWYENGQKKMTGSYDHDRATGSFVWWHPNGQKALAGQFDEQGRKVGGWTWWHPNGMKSIQGEYLAGVPQGDWTWWNDQGKVAQRTAFSLDRGSMVAGASPRAPARQLPRPVQQSRRAVPPRYLPYRQ